MRNLLQAMQDGYALVTGSGQFLVLFFLSIFVLWFFKKNELKELKWYATVVLVALLCPVTAWLFMQYQTSYYAYSELWLLLPATLLPAYLFTISVPACIEEIPAFRKLSAAKKRGAAEAICILIVGILLFLCGTMHLAQEKTERTAYGDVLPAETGEVVQKLPLKKGESLIVLAPDEIAKYLRICDGRIELPYGRFLTEEELRAYTYDTYAADTGEMHDWVNGTLSGMEETEISENYFSICASKEYTVLIFDKERAQEESFAEALKKQESYRYLDETGHYVMYVLNQDDGESM